ncbi:MAG TPA: BON domain-containing protein [Gemmatimonadaceae bacterium]|nr:BON domain-containing protein [Gemmatimonadaceae bacterium]
MATFRYRDEERTSSGILYMAAGALAGVAAGVLIAQRFGGLSGVTARVRDRLAAASRGDAEPLARYSTEREAMDDDDTLTAVRANDTGAYADEDGDDFVLEERVLTAFHNDPILSERAVDIGAVGEGIIELTGWVHSDDEAEHAITLTRGVPGVDTVVNRLAVRDEENNFRASSQRYADGDPALTEARWEGQQVGTGRRRQGSSAEADRHADPKPELEDRWLNKEHSVEAAADDMEGIAERRKSSKKQPKGDRTGGAPIAPSGVPKADHVADPASASEVAKDETGRDTYRAD